MKLLNWLGRLVIGCLGVIAAWGAWYVVYQDSLASVDEEKKPKPKKVLAVEAVAARSDAIDEQIVLVGTLLPLAQTEVRAKVNGYIEEMPFDIGDRVDKGDVICRLDPTDFHKSVEQAKAALKVAEAQLQVRVEETKLAKETLEIEERLATNNATTSQQVKTALANYKIALATEDLDRARVSEAQEYVDAIQKGLKDLVLTSPLTGYVAHRFADIGDLAKPDVPLLRIVDLETVETTVHVIEKDYRRIAVGQRAVVMVDAFAERSFAGEVTRIAPVLDPESRTAEVHINVGNSDLALKPGMYGRVLLDPDSQKTGVLIPLAAVVNVGNRSVVYVIDEATSKVEQRRVELGLSNGSVVEVRQGVSENELVVTLGNRLVQPNQEVVMTEARWPNNDSLARRQDSPSIETDAGD